MNKEFIPECYRKPVLVLGCGNMLFGDDGFGPAVIEYLEKNYDIPDDVCVMDAGTGVREILFTVALSDNKPERIIIIDSMDVGKSPGEIFEIPVQNIPENKIDDFSLHQLPTSNLLKELQELCKVQVTVIGCQVQSIPEKVQPGLSEPLVDSIPKACELIMKKIRCVKID